MGSGAAALDAVPADAGRDRAPPGGGGVVREVASVQRQVHVLVGVVDELRHGGMASIGVGQLRHEEVAKAGMRLSRKRDRRRFQMT